MHALRSALVVAALAAFVPSVTGCDDDAIGAGGSGGGTETTTTGASPTTTGDSGDGGSGEQVGGGGGGGAGRPACGALPPTFFGPRDGGVIGFERTDSGFAFAVGGTSPTLFLLDETGAELESVGIDTPPEGGIWLAARTPDNAWIVTGTLGQSGRFANVEVERIAGDDGESEGEDGIVAKIDDAGSAVWVRTFGSPDMVGEEQSPARAVVRTAAVRPDGGIVVVADLQGDTQVGDTVLEGDESLDDAFSAVIALDADGEVEWSRQGEPFFSVAFDPAGNVLLGSEQGSLALDAAGDEIWSSGEGGSFTIGADGGTYLFNGRMWGDDMDGLLSKLAPDGELVWQTRLDDSTLDFGGRLAVDDSGRATVVTYCGGIVDRGVGREAVATCDPTARFDRVSPDLCVVRFDEAGAVVDWSVFGDENDDIVHEVILEEDGSFLVASTSAVWDAQGETDFGSVYRVGP